MTDTKPAEKVKTATKKKKAPAQWKLKDCVDIVLYKGRKRYEYPLHTICNFYEDEDNINLITYSGTKTEKIPYEKAILDLLVDKYGYLYTGNREDE